MKCSFAPSWYVEIEIWKTHFSRTLPRYICPHFVLSLRIWGLLFIFWCLNLTIWHFLLSPYHMSRREWTPVSITSLNSLPPPQHLIHGVPSPVGKCQDFRAIFKFLSPLLSSDWSTVILSAMSIPLLLTTLQLSLLWQTSGKIHIPAVF